MDWSEGLSRVFAIRIMQWIVKIARGPGNGRTAGSGMIIAIPMTAEQSLPRLLQQCVRK
jgi:hypothetical protein